MISAHTWDILTEVRMVNFFKLPEEELTKSNSLGAQSF